MKINFYLLFTLIFSSICYGQVGVNTQSPNTTLDVSAKRNENGTLLNLNENLGIQAPRLTREELSQLTAVYGENQKGALIYITNVSAGNPIGQTININSIGYYYFDGSVWQKLENKNLYTGNGILTSVRTLDYNGYTLRFGTQTSGQSSVFSSTNGLTINKGTTGTRASLGLISGSSNLWLFNDENKVSQLIAGGTSKGLSLGASSTSDPSYISFITSVGGDALGTEKVRISSDGNVGIGVNNATEKLHINNGNVRISDLPLNGQVNTIYTKTDGSASTAKDQTFLATKTLVADANGVVGYVNDLPRTLNITKVDLPSVSYNHVGDNRTTAKYTGVSITIPPGTFKIDLSIGLRLSTTNTYTEGDNFVRFRLAESQSDVLISTYHPDAIYPRLASQGFAFSQKQGVVTGSLAVRNSSGAPKTYYLHVDNAASSERYLAFDVKNEWNESSLVYYPITSN